MSGDFGDLFEAFNFSLDDPTWKVLPAVLNSYGINDKLWQNYVLLICYGPPDNRTERCLNFDERPFLVFKELKNARRDPVFMVKHMREVRLPMSTPHKPATATVDSITPDITCSNGISYAIAISPYLADKSTELNVTVGNTFMVISRSQEWWVVQADPSGYGIVEDDPGKHFKVPAGCLLEIKVPVATALAEMRGELSTTFLPITPWLRMAILPLSAISTNSPGIALVDHKKQREDEIGLKKDDILRIFKSHNHWVYVEKDGDRGWVPEDSVAIGKDSG